MDNLGISEYYFSELAYPVGRLRSEMEPPRPKIPPDTWPIKASPGVLCRKWTLRILRDIMLAEEPRFTEILKSNPGLSPRLLAMRINELEREGYLRRVPSTADEREVYYALSTKGRDVVHVILALLRFTLKHEAQHIFPDGGPRRLEDVIPGIVEWAQKFAPQDSPE